MKKNIAYSVLATYLVTVSFAKAAESVAFKTFQSECLVKFRMIEQRKKSGIDVLKAYGKRCQCEAEIREKECGSKCSSEEAILKYEEAELKNIKEIEKKIAQCK